MWLIPPESWLGLFAVVAAAGGATVISAWFLGMNGVERQRLLSVLRRVHVRDAGVGSAWRDWTPNPRRARLSPTGELFFWKNRIYNDDIRMDDTLHILVADYVPIANKGEEAIVRGIEDMLSEGRPVALGLFDDVPQVDRARQCHSISREIGSSGSRAIPLFPAEAGSSCRRGSRCSFGPGVYGSLKNLTSVRGADSAGRSRSSSSGLSTCSWATTASSAWSPAGSSTWRRSTASGPESSAPARGSAADGSTRPGSTAGPWRKAISACSARSIPARA